MKKFFSLLCALAAVSFVATVSCSKFEPYDDSEIKEQISALDKRLQAVEALNKTVADLQSQIDGIHTLQFQVSADNEIQYSFDGGQTWTSTGVYLPVMPEIPEIPEPTVCLVSSVVDNGDYITFTLSDGTTFDVEKVEVVKFEILSGKQFFSSLETKSIPVVEKGMGTAMVAKAPKGWTASYSNGSLSVTAPNEEDAVWEEINWEMVCTNIDFSGNIEIWAVGEDNKMYVGSVGVALGECGTDIEVGSDYNTVKFSFADRSWETTPTYYGAAFKDEFDPQTIVNKILAYDTAGILSNEDPETYDFHYEIETTIEALAGRKPVAGEEVIVWALETTYDANYNLNMTKDDFIRVFVSPIEVQFNATPSFCDAALDIKVIGTDSFYGLALEGAYFDPEWFSIQDYISPMWGMATGYTYKSNTYTGSYSSFGQDPAYGMYNNAYQNSKYYVVIVPLTAGKALTEYTNDDCYIYDFTTTAITSGGSSSVTFGEASASFDYIEVAATTNGTLTYYTGLSDDDIALYGLDNDEAIAAYLLDPANYMVSITKESAFTAYQYGNPGENVTFVALPIDADGKYGSLAKLATAFKSIAYSSTVTLSIDQDATVAGVDYVDLKLNITGTPAKYVVYTPYWVSDNPKEYELSMGSASEGDYGYQFFTADDVKDGVLRVGGLTTGKETQILIIAVDEEGLYTPVEEYIGIPSLSPDAVVAKDAANWSAIDYAVYGDEACTTTEIVSRYFTDIYIQLTQAEKASTVYLVKQYISNVEGLDAAGTITNLLGAANKTAISVSDWNEEGKYVKYYSTTEEENVYLFWCDAEGNFYEPVIIKYETVPAE